jgi:hypothetical protein
VESFASVDTTAGTGAGVGAEQVLERGQDVFTSDHHQWVVASLAQWNQEPAYEVMERDP